jgi:hypothetical protein
MRRRAAATAGLALAILAVTPATASASFLDPVCSVVGTFTGKLFSWGCKGIAHPGKIITVGQKLLGGHLGGVLHTITGGGGNAAGRALGLAALVVWVLGGARFALHETATLIGHTTSPDLANAWFSSTYTHMAAIGALLTLPFLFAATVQALMRSDLAMLARAALGYLPLALLAVALAAPMTTLLLAASDNASNIIERAASGGATDFLTHASVILGGLSLAARSPFVAFLIGFFIAVGALLLWLELLLREVAVYVIVLMLPLVFAAFVWPARRIWTIRAIEMLVALILSKLAIVSVLALGSGALHHAIGSSSIVSLAAGIALVGLGAFAPWALVKLMPLGELAAAAAGPLSGQLREARREGVKLASPWADASTEWAGAVIGDMRRHAMAADPAPDEGGDPEAESSPDGVEGVTGGEDPDPLRGTADPPGGPAPAGPGPTGTPAGPTGTPAGPTGTPAGPTGTPAGPTGTPAAAPEGGPHASNTGPSDRGPSPPFQGLPGAEDFYQRKREWPGLILGKNGMPPRPADDEPELPAAAADGDDPLLPSQDPEDGRL